MEKNGLGVALKSKGSDQEMFSLVEPPLSPNDNNGRLILTKNAAVHSRKRVVMSERVGSNGEQSKSDNNTRGAYFIRSIW
jgi:hypothetical protein